ncbi:MAG: polynucleotide 5'-hydroxyl-kinase, partial [Actinobacteria bacterium]|nr:polynucleotide 5'-hydroxyl-kinase [Actinomycetota bacterium]
VIGGMDSGKSTFANLLLKEMNGEAFLLEADPGQPSHTLPGTFALVNSQGNIVSRYFIGDVSPLRNLSDVFNGIYLLSRRTSGRSLIIDSSGYVSDDFAVLLKIAKANIARADSAVLIEKEEGQLEKIEFFLLMQGMTVLKCRSSKRARQHSQEERRKRRSFLLRSYFKDGIEKQFNLEDKALLSLLKEEEVPTGKLFSFENSKGICLEVGVVRSISPSENEILINALVKNEVEKFSRIKIGRINFEENLY